VTGCTVQRARSGCPYRGKAPGPEPLLSDEQRLALLRIVEARPIPASHGVVRWRLIELVDVGRVRHFGQQADPEP